MESEATAAARRENPRTRRVRQLVLETAVEVLLERGADEVTAVNVAEEADVARTTIYRHWPDQRSLLLATIEQLTTAHHTHATDGPLADDVRSALEALRLRLVTREVRSVFGALAGRAPQDDTFGDAQRLFISQLTQPMVDVLEAAAGRGELEADVDGGSEAALLVGPLLHRYLVLVDEIPDELIDEVVRRWLATVRS